MTEISLKQGATFPTTGQAVADDGVTPRSLVGKTLTSQIRDEDGNLVTTLTLAVTNAANGDYSISVPGGTSTWPVATLYWDIKESDGTNITYTETITIVVSRSETRL